MRDIVIIGAGAAGLMAAHAIREAGETALILESRNRVGGRVLTAGSDPLVEIGAEFLHGETPVTDRLMKRFGLTDYELEYRPSRFVDGKLTEDPHFWDRLARVLGEIRTPKRDLAFAEYLARYDSHSALDQKLSRGFVEGFDAADLDHVSTRALYEMRDQVADPKSRRLRRMLQGYSPLLQALATPIERQIRFQHRVDRIEWKRGQVRIDGSVVGSGRRFRRTARAVILTLPLSVLQEIEVWPRLESFQHVLDQNHMGHVTKWIVRMDSDFFEPYLEQGFPFITAPDLHFTAWWGADPIHWPTVTAWSGGRRGQVLSMQPEERQLDCLVGELARISRRSRRKIEGWLEAAWTHNWSQDPDSRGAYSYPAVRRGLELERVQTAYEQTLFLAGEAFHPQMTGTVEGALSTGELAAKKALRGVVRARGSRGKVTKSATRGERRASDEN